MTAPQPWPAVPVPEDVDPVERWLTQSRCCGAPQLCGARCMDDEESATAARVARELDDARGRIVELEGKVEAVRELRAEYERTVTEAEEAAASFPREEVDARVDLLRRAGAARGAARRIRAALGEEL